MPVKPWRKIVRNVKEDEYIRPPVRGYILSYDKKAGDYQAFVEDASKSIADILEDAKASNEKAGRTFTYKVAKDGMSATWRLTHTNVKRVTTGKLKRYKVKRSA